MKIKKPNLPPFLLLPLSCIAFLPLNCPTLTYPYLSLPSPLHLFSAPFTSLPPPTSPPFLPVLPLNLHDETLGLVSGLAAVGVLCEPLDHGRVLLLLGQDEVIMGLLEV